MNRESRAGNQYCPSESRDEKVMRSMPKTQYDNVVTSVVLKPYIQKISKIKEYKVFLASCTSFPSRPVISDFFPPATASPFFPFGFHNDVGDQCKNHDRLFETHNVFLPNQKLSLSLFLSCSLICYFSAESVKSLTRKSMHSKAQTNPGHFSLKPLSHISSL